jgi:outer membrane protein with beta-barrel domain
MLVLLSFSSAAAAQDNRGVSAGASASATNLNSRTSWSFAGSFEYRFNRVAGLEVEATGIPTLKSTFSPIAFPASSISSFVWASGPAGSVTSLLRPSILPTRFENEGGRAVIFTNNVRVHIPTTADRIDPYFVAGGGIASIRRTADLVFGPLTLTPDLIGLGLTPFPGPSFRQPFTSSSVDLALTLGGGVSVRAAPHVWIDGDLRLFRLLGDEDRNLGRFGAGVRYRF